MALLAATNAYHQLSRYQKLEADIDERSPFFMPPSPTRKSPQVYRDVLDLPQRLGHIRAGVLVADVAEDLHGLVALVDQVDICQRAEVPGVEQLVAERGDCRLE